MDTLYTCPGSYAKIGTTTWPITVALLCKNTRGAVG